METEVSELLNYIITYLKIEAKGLPVHSFSSLPPPVAGEYMTASTKPNPVSISRTVSTRFPLSTSHTFAVP